MITDHDVEPGVKIVVDYRLYPTPQAAEPVKHMISLLTRFDRCGCYQVLPQNTRWTVCSWNHATGDGDLRGEDLCHHDVQALFTVLHQCSFTDLRLRRLDVGAYPGFISVFLDTLAHIPDPHLRCLEVYDFASDPNAGMSALSAFIKSPGAAALEQMFVPISNRATAQEWAQLVSALHAHPKLELDVYGGVPRVPACDLADTDVAGGCYRLPAFVYPPATIEHEFMRLLALNRVRRLARAKISLAKMLALQPRGIVVNGKVADDARPCPLASLPPELRCVIASFVELDADTADAEKRVRDAAWQPFSGPSLPAFW